VDDHEIVRKGLSALLAGEPDFEVVGQAANGQEGLELLKILKPDLALVDIRMKGMNGPALCRAVRQEGLDTALVILTSYPDDYLIETCLQLGIQGYLLKEIQGFDLIQSIRTIMDGGSVLDPKATRLAMQLLQNDSTTAAPVKSLSPKELDILRLMADGLSNKEIGERLYLSENTIKTYVIEIFRRLGAKNRIDAVVTAYRLGML
jgi:DNA-binding NarL/FixJ family response regulator